MTGRASLLTDTRATTQVHITAVRGRTMVANTAGTARVVLITDTGEQTTTLHDVLHAPGLAVNHFSVKAIIAHGFAAFFSGGGVAIQTRENMVFRGRAHGNVLVLPLAQAHDPKDHPGEKNGLAGAAVGIKVWHARLAHPGVEAVLRAPGQVDGMEVAEAAPRAALKALCEPCVLGKQTRGPFPSSTTKTTAAMDLLHMDLCGPMPVPSTGGANYLLGLVDDTSGNAAVVPVRLKSLEGAAAAVKIKEWETTTRRPTKMTRTDRGGGFVNKATTKWAHEGGVIQQTTAPYTPQQNGKAERFNRSLMEKVTAVMSAAKCDKALWGEATATVTYAMNRTARAGHLLTPHELWCGQRPAVAHVRTFGC